MGKKRIFLLLLSITIVVLSGCSRGIDATRYLEDVEFIGMNGSGRMEQSASIDTTAMYTELKQIPRIESLLGKIKVTVDKNVKLKNDDVVTVTIEVPDSLKGIVTGGTKTYKVSGLEDPTFIMNDEIAKHLHIRFDGVSGKGNAYIEKSFSDPIAQNIEFDVENNGSLENGQTVNVIVSPETYRYLENNKYALDPYFNVSIDVSGLSEVPQSAKDIVNLSDLQRMIVEAVKREFEDGWSTQYEIGLVKYMYRQHGMESGVGDFYGSRTNSGNLVGIYTIKKYSVSGNNSNFEEEFTAIVGFTDIILDTQGKANVAEIQLVFDKKDKTYSKETVINLYEGYGYKDIE